MNLTFLYKFIWIASETVFPIILILLGVLHRCWWVSDEFQRYGMDSIVFEMSRKFFVAYRDRQLETNFYLAPRVKIDIKICLLTKSNSPLKFFHRCSSMPPSVLLYQFAVDFQKHFLCFWAVTIVCEKWWDQVIWTRCIVQKLSYV